MNPHTSAKNGTKEALVRFGDDGELKLQLAAESLLAECGAPEAVPLDDPAAAVAAAMLDPIEFPPLAQAIVPGDRIVIALEDGLPQAAALVAGAVVGLLDAGVEASQITVLRSPAESASTEIDPRSHLQPEVAEAIELATHDPDTRDRLAYLGASSEGKPIYLNRLLCDAEFVLPIGCLRVDDSLAYHGVHTGLFPTFADTETLERFRAPSSADLPVHRHRRRDEANEAGWLLGVLFTIQVVPGAGDSVLHVLAGHVNAVGRRGGELADATWSDSVTQRASLVVAAIEGGAARQTWDNIARALSAASRVVADGGAIALCTELDTPPGPVLRELAGTDDLDAAIHQVRRERSADALPAAQLLHAMDRAKVYLLSRLDEEEVEELGVAPVGDATEIIRLASRHPTCIVLSNADYVVATPAEDE